MKKTVIIGMAALSVFLMTQGTAKAETRSTPPGSNEESDNRMFTGGVQLGYYDGVGVHVSGTVANFAEGFPFKLRLGLGYSWVPTGDALLARRVFIDNNTNGSPQSKGKIWDARMDVMYPVSLFSLKQAHVFGGVRRANFTAHFEYIGGAETFDVNNNQWGIGGGLENTFAVSPRVDMFFSLGADYYFRTTMSGHDTYYRPNGDDLHAIANYTYKDADAAINQPDFNTRLMAGILYRF